MTVTKTFLSFLSRVKKEFEGAAASTTSSTDKNLFEPKLVTIPDEAQNSSNTVGIVPEGGLQQIPGNKEAVPAVDELDVLGASASTAASAAATGLPPLPPQGGKNPLAAKLEATRKFSQSLAEAECDFEVEEEDDFDPHFQRVYISGDDNTGVSLSFYSCFVFLTLFVYRRTIAAECTNINQ